jgi:hypothetical protein
MMLIVRHNRYSNMSQLRPTTSLSDKTNSVFSSVTARQLLSVRPTELPFYYQHGEMISIDHHSSTVSFPLMGQGGSSNSKATYRNPRSGSQFVQADSHSERPLHPILLVGSSCGKPHDKPVGNNGADSDDDFIPATSTAQATTISHNSPTNFYSPVMQRSSIP